MVRNYSESFRDGERRRESLRKESRLHLEKGNIFYGQY